MRALADPSRLALHDALRRSGPATADDLARLLNSQPTQVLENLAALEDVGLVKRDDTSGEQRWAVIGRGVFFEIPEDGEGQDAARQLSNTMLLQYVDLPRRWVAEDEPQLTLAWARAVGMLNVRVRLTPDELRDLQAALEVVLEPYLTRSPDETPVDASDVRVLAYFMPEPSQPE